MSNSYLQIGLTMCLCQQIVVESIDRLSWQTMVPDEKRINFILQKPEYKEVHHKNCIKWSIRSASIFHFQVAVESWRFIYSKSEQNSSTIIISYYETINKQGTL